MTKARHAFRLVATAVAHLDDGRTPVTGEAFARQCDACVGHDALARGGAPGL